MASERENVNDELERTIERGIRKLQLVAFQALTSSTPVLTGFARSTWTPSEGVPDSSGPTERPADEQVAREQAKKLFAEHEAASKAIAASYRLRKGPVYITSVAKYMRYLNDGSSAQAPKKFIEEALDEAVKATRSSF